MRHVVPEAQAALAVDLPVVTEAEAADRVQVEMVAVATVREQEAGLEFALELARVRRRRSGATTTPEALDLELAERTERPALLGLAENANDRRDRRRESAEDVPLPVADEGESCDRRAPHGESAAEDALLTGGAHSEAVGHRAEALRARAV